MKNSLIPAILLAAMAISCKGDNSKTAAPKDPVKVKVIRVEKQAAQSNKTYVGRVESATDINISSPFSAKLVSIKVKPGQKVKKGDILAELYSEHIETMFTSAQATVNQAQDAYDRLLKVKDNGSVRTEDGGSSNSAQQGPGCSAICHKIQRRLYHQSSDERDCWGNQGENRRGPFCYAADIQIDRFGASGNLNRCS